MLRYKCSRRQSWTVNAQWLTHVKNIKKSQYVSIFGFTVKVDSPKIQKDLISHETNSLKNGECFALNFILSFIWNIKLKSKATLKTSIPKFSYLIIFSFAAKNKSLSFEHNRTGIISFRFRTQRKITCNWIV